MTIENALNRFATYIRRQDGVRAAAWGLASGLGTALALNAIARLAPVLDRAPRVVASICIPALATLLAFLGAYLYPRTALTIARRSDERLGLRARLATAIEIERQELSVPTEIAVRQRADARAVAARADPKTAFAIRLPRRATTIAAPLCALLIGALLLPNPQEARIAQRRADQQIIAEQAERLERIRDEIAANEQIPAADKEALLRELDSAIQDLREGELSREQALARLSEVQEHLEERLTGERSDQQAALREAGQHAIQGEHTQELGRALIENDLGTAAEAATSLGQELSQMSPAEIAETAERLSRMADSLANTQPELAQSLRDASSAMRDGDQQAAQDALNRAAEQLAASGQQIAAQEATEQALGQIQEGRRALAQAGGTEGMRTESASGSGDPDSGTPGEGDPQDPGGPIPPNQPGAEGETAYDPVFVPERLGEGEGQEIRIEGEGQEGPPGGETGDATEPGEGEKALVPYDEVYTDYQAQAISALENSYIPQSIKEYVRAYFGALEPE
jgi:hypothetical protein